MMRRLFPSSSPEVSDDDLVELYTFPEPVGRSRPWVRANFVASADGAAQGRDFKSGSLSGAADRRVFALLRALCDVILVGAGTTRVEGYKPVRPEESDTDLRTEQDLEPLPAIAVVSRSLNLDPELVKGSAAPTVVVTVQSAPADALARMRELAPVVVAGEHDVDFGEALRQLATQGYRRMLCEGGPTLMHSLVAADCLDDLCLTLSPTLIAGERLRITHGPTLDPPRDLRLAHLIEDDGELFARYCVDRPDNPGTMSSSANVRGTSS